MARTAADVAKLLRQKFADDRPLHHRDNPDCDCLACTAHDAADLLDSKGGKTA